MTDLDNRTDGQKVVDAFLDGQSETPLSSASAVETAIRLLEAGVSLVAIANTSLDENQELFDRALLGTLARHKAAGASRFTSLEAVRRRLPEAYRINQGAILGVAAAAALGREIDGPIRAMRADDEVLEEAQAVLSTSEGRRRALGVLGVVKQAYRSQDIPLQPTLFDQYQAAQMHSTDQAVTRLFPGPDTERRRQQLMQHLRLRIGRVAIGDRDAQAVIKTFLRDDLDPISLRLEPRR